MLICLQNRKTWCLLIWFGDVNEVIIQRAESSVLSGDALITLCERAPGRGDEVDEGAVPGADEGGPPEGYQRQASF